MALEVEVASRLRCMVLETPKQSAKKTLLHELYEQEKQSPWYDNLSRPVTTLQPFIDNGIRGVTSNPTVRFYQLSLCASVD